MQKPLKPMWRSLLELLILLISYKRMISLLINKILLKSLQRSFLRSLWISLLKRN
ncbi:hypothetical protein Hamer_G029715 [Homarus americanus]|uniref:Uncharacterized protein n=1 Tax=Homarus americanus TaxID=6706 RepID=A0A8J5MR02_HOMAM|nr:hypothetical protein Hamer_G029715 [Homarus americanus]